MEIQSTYMESLSRRRREGSGFTLIELLVSMAILAVLMSIVATVIGLAQRTWSSSNARVSQFREARMAFDTISRNLSQSVLNTYWQNEFDEIGPDAIGESRTKAKNYVRESELQWVSGPTVSLLPAATSVNNPGHAVFFQAPLGITYLQNSQTENMVSLLCGRGYFVSWGDDLAFRPPFLAGVVSVRPRYRYRLMEYSPPAEKNRIYDQSLKPITSNSMAWFQDAIGTAMTATETANTRAVTRPVAENIIALIISPQVETGSATGSSPTSIAPGYAYDSTKRDFASAKSPQGIQHLLPPLVRIAMVAIDQPSAETLAMTSTASPDLLGSSGASFSSASAMDSDLLTLGNYLVSQKINYRIFTTVVGLKQAKWSL